MTRAGRVLRILLKDLRAFRLEIAGLALLNILLVAVSAEPWAVLVERSFERNDLNLLIDARGWIAGLIIAACWIVIARVVQADLPASRTQYWLTRPYPRSGLLLAKLLFIALVVHLLSCISQIIILASSQLSFSIAALLVYQLKLAVMLSLPAAAISSLTRTLGRFLIASLAVITVTGMLLMFGGLLGEEAYLNLDGLIDPYPHRLDNWIRVGIGQILFALIVASALVWQYRHRASLRVAVGLATALVAVTVVVLVLPHWFSSWVNTMRFGPVDSVPAIRFSESSANSPARLSRQAALNYYELPAFLAGTDPIWENIIEIPIDFPDRDPRLVKLGNASVRVSTESGIRISAKGGVWRNGSEYDYGIRFRLPREAYSSIRNESASIRIELDMLQYRSANSVTIPTDGSPVTVESGAQCGIAWTRVLLCRSPSYEPGSWALGSESPSNRRVAVLTRGIGHRPINPNPVSLFRFEPAPFGSFYWSSPADHPLATPIPVITRTPSGYTKLRVEIDALRLSEWSLGDDASGDIAQASEEAR